MSQAATTYSELRDIVEKLQNVCVARATGGGDDSSYERYRSELLSDPFIKGRVPRFIRNCRDSPQFWQYIKYKFSKYSERRTHIWSAFRPLLDQLESLDRSPSDATVGDILPELNSDYVHAIWERALERRVNDPEGAVTLSRTLLESVCKHILDEAGESYPNDADLPRLYRLTSEQLTVAPSQHSAQVFKQILGGCTAVVEGLGALRNRVGDAHGQGRRPVKPAPRHAELAVNLAGTMAMFLVSTWLARQEASQE
ncbi:MAG: abortive infection family protein [Planctomycetota bacterium]|jgi:hypothetical protein